MRLLFALGAVLPIVGCTSGASYSPGWIYGDGGTAVPTPTSYEQTYQQDAYGPGIHADATGRPFEWRTNEGETTYAPVQPNGYGLGVGMDAYGRPVTAQPR